MSFYSTAQMQEQTCTEPLIYQGILQRKCDCGQENIAGGECGDHHTSGQSFNLSSIGPFAASRFGGDFSRVRLHSDEAEQTRPLLRTQPMVQRSLKNGETDSSSCANCPEAESMQTSGAAEAAAEDNTPISETAPTSVPSESTEETPIPEETASPGLIVEDEAAEVGPGQMRKSEFLAQLRAEICRTAEAAMAGTSRTTEDCPYLDFWFGYYSRQDSLHIERAIRRYAPESASASSASGYIPIISARVRQSVEKWARTGEITGLPEGIPAALSGTSLLGGLVSGVGSIFFKARNGGARTSSNPRAIQTQLGRGRPLDGGVRSRMESAFGMDFAHVRTHTDAAASGLSDGLNARAFTVGKDIAFGSGEYKPGTLIGDALIAHELAHVVQQGGVNTSVAPLQAENTGRNIFEQDADSSAMGALASLWGGAKEKMADIAQNAIPRLRSGLGLQRCPKETCSEGDKSISVDFVRLRGATGNPTTDLTNANKAYKKCCVKFTKGKNELVPNKLSDTWLGGDTDLKRTTACGSLHAEEKAMFDGAKKKYGLSSRIHVFYVKSFTPGGALAYSNPPYCATGTAAPYVNHSVVKDNTVKNTLAHEFGHTLLNSGSETGIDNPSDRNNLMYGPGTGFDLDKSQCKKIYNNA